MLGGGGQLRTDYAVTREDGGITPLNETYRGDKLRQSKRLVAAENTLSGSGDKPMRQMKLCLRAAEPAVCKLADDTCNVGGKCLCLFDFFNHLVILILNMSANRLFSYSEYIFVSHRIYFSFILQRMVYFLFFTTNETNGTNGCALLSLIIC